MRCCVCCVIDKMDVMDARDFIHRVMKYHSVDDMYDVTPRQIESFIEGSFLEYVMYHGDGFNKYMTVLNVMIKHLENGGEEFKGKLGDYLVFRRRELESSATMIAEFKVLDGMSFDDYLKTKTIDEYEENCNRKWKEVLDSLLDKFDKQLMEMRMSL